MHCIVLLVLKNVYAVLYVLAQSTALGAKPELAKVGALVSLGGGILKQLSHPRAVEYICGPSPNVNEE